MIAAPGIGSGLDISGIIKQLMSLERRPLQLLEQRQGTFKAQISAYGKVKSAVADFRSALAELNASYKLRHFDAASSDEAIAGASASRTAAPGSYEVEVLQLARQHRAFARETDPDATYSGTLTIDAEGFDGFTVDLGEAVDLAGVRNAINEHADNRGVRATLVTGDNERRLILTSIETGEAFAFEVTGSGTLEALATQFGATDEHGAPTNLYQQGQDARAVVDGVEVSRTTNQITGVVSGLTIDLVAEGNVTLRITRDDAAITERVEAMVDAYNTLRSTIEQERKGQLQADSTLLRLETSLRTVFNSPAPEGETFRHLVEVGVSFDRNGRLTLDKSQLEAALERDFAGVASLFGDEAHGFAARLHAATTRLIDPDGLLDARTKGLDSNIRRLDTQLDQMEARLVQTEERLRREFTALDALVGRMNNTSQYLAQQLAMLQLYR